MEFEFEKLSVKDRYNLLRGFIVPRPIALVTTRSLDGKDNAAPFSFFNGLSEDPPLVVLGLENGDDGTPKDTTRNIHQTGEFVVHLVDVGLAKAMSICAIDFPSGESEGLAAGLTLVASRAVRVPRILEAPASFECRQRVTLQFGPKRTIVIGEALWAHVREGLYDAKTRHVDVDSYHPVGRLFGPWYAHTNERFKLLVPTYDEWLKAQNIGNATTSDLEVDPNAPR